MFNGASFNQPIGNWDTSAVTNMSGMFYTSSFNQEIGDWDVSSVTNMSGMFSVAWNFNQKLEDWDVSIETDISYMFDWEREGLENPIPSQIKGSLHETFSNNPTWTHDWSAYIPPKNLSANTPLSISENQPIGTIVGDFNVTDANDGNITYQLISGDGFTLDIDGTLYRHYL